MTSSRTAIIGDICKPYIASLVFAQAIARVGMGAGKC